MNQSSVTRPPLLVQIARSIRHAPCLRAFEPLWNSVRPAYQQLLRQLAGQRGLPIDIEGIGSVYVPASFLGGDVDRLELPMLRRFFQAIMPDTCLYDIGASIGLHSLVAGKQMTQEAEIHAFEPDLPSCKRYLANTELLRQKFPVHLSRCFVSDVSTTSEPMTLSPVQLIENSPELASQASQHLYLFAQPQDEQIPQIRLDDYVRAGARPPTVIKCDIEGAELVFLQGAVEILQHYRPILLISLHPDLIGNFNSTPEDFYRFLHSQGYEWEILNEIGETHVYAQPANR